MFFETREDRNLANAKGQSTWKSDKRLAGQATPDL
jgi:hypothetical protein